MMIRIRNKGMERSFIMNAPAKKVMKEDVFEYIKDLVRKNGTNEIQLSASQISKHFNISIPTAHYHITNLVNDGLLIQLPKRGKHNTKYYKVKEASDSKSSVKLFNLNEIEKFKKELEKTLKQTTKDLSSHVADKSVSKTDTDHQEDTDQKQKEEKKEQHLSISETEESKEPVSVSYEEIPDFPKLHSVTEPLLEEKPLTLDERIERFLKESENVASAEQLLTREDREVLAVMNETIQQNIVYLKDLSEQLSTIQNKKLIQELIDERNRLLEQIKRLNEQNELLQQQLKDTQEKHQLDPQRLRIMQQNIIHFVDTWLDQPNHALALGRRQFRETLVKHINDVFRYVLGLESSR
jgi:hypothetical protein